MNNLLRSLLGLTLLLLGSVALVLAQTIDQRLLVVTNAGTLGGSFQVAVQVKGTGLPAENTLGSATIDVMFDNTKLTYVNATVWAFGPGDGYTRSTTNPLGTFIRVGVTGGGVGPGFGTVGYDIPSSYATWVQLNFTIASTSGSTNLTIDPVTNAVGLFNSHANSNELGDITNKTLSAPINIVSVPLPVQLASFTGSMVGQTGQVKLEWSTASETNNYGFEVQKAGTDEGAAYATIPNSFVAGHGTTIEPHAYAFTDVTVTQGTSYYRLKQIDLDGTVHYSDGVRSSGVTGVAVRPLPTAYALDQNFPNPFNPVTIISFALPKETRTTLEVFNLQGQRISVLVDETRPAGYYIQTFDGTNNGSGIYFCRITAGEFSMTRKLLLLH